MKNIIHIFNSEIEISFLEIVIFCRFWCSCLTDLIPYIKLISIIESTSNFFGYLSWICESTTYTVLPTCEVAGFSETCLLNLILGFLSVCVSFLMSSRSGKCDDLDTSRIWESVCPNGAMSEKVVRKRIQRWVQTVFIP